MKFVLSAEYGELRQTGVHKGIDIAMPKNTELKAFEDGVVTQVFDGSTPIGKGVKIQLENGQEAIYGHLEKVNVKIGEILKEGETIGYSGNTGRVTGENGGYHLHFGLKQNGAFIDPTNMYDSIVSHAGSNFDWKVLFQNSPYFNQTKDSLMDKFFSNLGENLSDFMIQSAHDFAIWLTSVMPDIGAYMTVITGVLIMVTAKTGKWLAWYSAGMFGVVAWLMNAE